MATITGTNSGETLNGTSEADIINGLGGSDTLNGLGGNDVLDGGEGDDTLNGGEGDDELRALSGFDSGNGGAGTDTLVADFSAATATVFSEVRPAANGTLGGFDGTYLESGVRRVGYTSVERFVITTGSGADDIFTASGDDVVRTGAGDDRVNVGSGIDTADGGTGVDGLSADFSADPAGVSIDLRNAVNSGAFGSFSNFEYFGTVTGSAFNDRLIGSQVSPNGQTINLGAGDDTGGVSRGVGRGGGTVNGGVGNDTLIVDFSAATASVFNEEGPFPNTTVGGFNGSFLEDGTARASYTSIERFEITTGSGNDTITTGSGDDVVRTGLGNDVVNVGSGINTADGGEGFDGVSADFSAAGAGATIDLRNNSVNSGAFGSFSNFEYFGTITGTALNDLLIGGDVAQAQIVNLGAGDDVGGVGRGGGTINGGAGADTAVFDFSAATTAVVNEAGPTANTALGGFDGSFLQPNAGNRGSYTSVERFIITTGSSNDNLTTASGDDIIRTNGGNDTVIAGDGADLVDGGAGDDNLNGGGGTGDTVSFESATAGVTVDLRLTTAQNTGGAGTDTLSNFERIIGSAFADTLTGTDAANWLDGGAGADTLIGLGGSDNYFIDNAGDVIVEQAGGGTLDTVFTALASYTLAANVESLFGESDAGQSLTGNDLNNEVFAGAGNDILNGGAGADTLVGSLGNDILDGGTGADRLSGGDGNDIYIVDDIGDVVGEALALNGTEDEVRTSLASYALTENIERLTGTSNAGQSLTGNTLVNIIIGAGGNDTLNGGSGADTLRGGAGNDTYVVDNAGDVVTENAGEGTDEVRTALAAYMLGANLENLTGTSAAGQTLTGNAFANVITGGAGNDTIDGGAGADALRGGAGNDTYTVDNAGDVVTENAGEGTDTVRTALASYTLAANVENLTYTGTAAASLRGNASNNVINGAGANDVFFLQDGGNDVVTGLGGDDGFYFGAALTALDEVDGGAGTLDQVALQGNYAALTLGAKNLVGIEQLVLLPGNDARFGDTSGALYSYNLTTVDANVAAGQRLVVTANTLRSGENLTFNGAAELDGFFLTYGGLGTDVITGGQKDDGFFFGTGGRFGANDRVDGQGGSDQLGLQGLYTGANAITFGADQLKGIEFIVLLSGGDTRFGSGGVGYSYDLTTNNGNVAAGQTMVVSANNLRADETLTFNGAAETDGRFRIFSGAGADVITGGAGNDEISGLGGNDRIAGGLGADRLTGGEGADTFVYGAAAESTGLGFDTLIGFDSRVDRIDLPGTIGAVTDLLGGTLRRASFDADLATAVNGQLDPNAAVLFTATSGDSEFAGRSFAVIDANGDGAYQAGVDYVIEIVTPAVPITPGTDFFI